MSESQLIADAKAGDQSAFSELVKQNESRLYNVCLRLTANHHDAEDAFAAAVYLGWRNLTKFRGDSGFGTWMYRIASNASLELVRKRRPDLSIDAPVSDDNDASSLEIADPVAEFERSIADNDALNRALSHIPPTSREALILAEVAGFSLAEIAEHQNSTLSATKVRVHRARRSLRDLLQP